jgi:DNA-directed RNA polymerase subunit RPC12/RpoP
LARVQAETAAEPNEDHEPYACSECGATFADLEEAVTLYECKECGETFTQETSANYNHQCPTCNRFGSKHAENGCPDCNQGVLERKAEITDAETKE